jgi:tricorn protease
VQVDPIAEWKQMFNEVWRQERDYFYEAAMNGVDWENARQVCPPAAVSSTATPDLYHGRDDRRTLTRTPTLVAETIPTSVNVGLSGWISSRTKPLVCIASRRSMPAKTGTSRRARPGGRNYKGDYLVAVTGRSLRAAKSLRTFLNTVSENVTLTINSKASEEGAHTAGEAYSDENSLRELAC